MIMHYHYFFSVMHQCLIMIHILLFIFALFNSVYAENDPKKCNCGRQYNYPARIFSGAQANANSKPWVVLIRACLNHEFEGELGAVFESGGVLLSNRHVLTAASEVTPS